MYIRLSGYYQGSPSKERVIVPGTYRKNDPALFNLAAYLVKNGHAEEISPEAIPELLPLDEITPPKKGPGRPKKSVTE